MLRIKTPAVEGPEADPKLAEALRKILHSLPPSLSFTSNFGWTDVLPAGSGKRRACEYLASEEVFALEGGLSRCVAMGDDDNDIEMVRICRVAVGPVGATFD